MNSKSAIARPSRAQSCLAELAERAAAHWGLVAAIAFSANSMSMPKRAPEASNWPSSKAGARPALAASAPQAAQKRAGKRAVAMASRGSDGRIKTLLKEGPSWIGIPMKEGVVK